MPRKPLPLGTWGKISRTESQPGRWIARCRFRDFDGRTRKVEAWGKSGAAAERALMSSLRDRATPGLKDITPDTRMSDLATAWLAEIDRSELSSNSRSRYATLVDKHVTPGVGGLRIREATVGALDRFIRSVEDNVGSPTAKGCRVVLAGMLGLAARHDAAPRNIIRDTTPQRPSEPRSKSSPNARSVCSESGSSEDPAAVRAGIPDLVDFMLGTGVRIGEALGVRWADVDLGGQVPTVKIAGTVVRVAGSGLIIQDHPKTASGRRKLKLPPFVVAMLLRRQMELIESNPWDVVFPSSTGTLREPQNVHRQWRAARDRAGFSWVTPHTFRKGVATAIGIDNIRAAADQLGHAGTAVTERHYVAKTHEGPDARAVLEPFGQG